MLGHIVEAQENMIKAESWLDTARDDRDHWIAQLRTMGWTLRQISEFTGLSISGLEKISRQQNVRSTRGAEITVVG